MTPNEWTRLAVALEQPEPEQIQIVVHGLLHEEVGVRRLFLPAFSISLLEEMTQGLWPELDYLNKVIYLVSPQPLQGHLDEITIILEFYDPWMARDLSIKPIMLECLQPGPDDIHRLAKYCPERVTKETFPVAPSGCPDHLPFASGTLPKHDWNSQFLQIVHLRNKSVFFLLPTHCHPPKTFSFYHKVF